MNQRSFAIQKTVRALFFFFFPIYSLLLMNYGQFLLNLPNHIHCCILFHVRSTNVKSPDLANRKAEHIDAEFIYKKGSIFKCLELL